MKVSIELTKKDMDMIVSMLPEGILPKMHSMRSKELGVATVVDFGFDDGGGMKIAAQGDLDRVIEECEKAAQMDLRTIVSEYVTMVKIAVNMTQKATKAYREKGAA